MRLRRDRRGVRRQLWTTLALVATLAVVGCGKKDEKKDTNNVSTAVNTIFNASPAAGTPGRGGLPESADTETVSIKDGKLDPKDIEGTVGQAFILTVNGDGTSHILEIERLVTGQNVKANGETLIQFTVPTESVGQKTIRLDGKDAGTFDATTAGGGTDQ